MPGLSGVMEMEPIRSFVMVLWRFEEGRRQMRFALTCIGLLGYKVILLEAKSDTGEYLH